MLNNVFRILYIIGFIAGSVIRTIYTRGNRKSDIASDHETTLDKLLLSLASLGLFVIPLFYLLSSWLDFADYRLPMWAALAFTRRPGAQLAAGAANQGGAYVGNPGRLPSYPASRVRRTLLVGNCPGFTAAKLDCRLVYAGFFSSPLLVSRLA